MKTPWRRHRLLLPDTTTEPWRIFRPRESRDFGDARRDALHDDKMMRIVILAVLAVASLLGIVIYFAVS
jgi:hypothetical protein